MFEEEDSVGKKELLQQRHYKLLQELQTMARDLPAMYQQRLPYELLSSLANSLLDNTVFEIVKGLKEIQHMTEKSLFESRISVLSTQKATKIQMMRKHKEALCLESQSQPNDLPTLQTKCDQELLELEKAHEEERNRLEMKIIIELDQAVSDQQVTLEKAGVPGFFVSNKPSEVRLQMYLLEFIMILYNNAELANNET